MQALLSKLAEQKVIKILNTLLSKSLVLDLRLSKLGVKKEALSVG